MAGDQGDERAEGSRRGLEHPHRHDHGDPTGLPGRLLARARPHRHDHVASIDPALESDQRGIRALKVSLVGLALTAAAQLAVVAATGSVALLSDTLHNAADALTALPIWLAFVLARRPATRRFPYGYGRAEDLAGLVVLVFIAGSALLAAWESAGRLLHPTEVRHLWAVAAAGLLGFVGNELIARYRIRVGRSIGSAALVADGLHARTDGFTSLGVVAGASGVAAGFPAADPIAGLLIAAMIVALLVSAARDVLLRMLDAIDPAILAETEDALVGVTGVEEVGAVRIRWIGHRLHAETEVVVDERLTVADAHAVAERARHALLHEVPHLASAIIHADPCGHGGTDAHTDLAHHGPTTRHPPDRPRRAGEPGLSAG